jgi:hypothetical protein
MLAASGQNPRLDLGASILAAHRVGAAACEEAASSPLLDEVALIEHLAAAREKLAPSMINSVSKSVTGDGYASLLVRDLFDDAEAAALELFRAQIARGVAAPMAATRVGAVYGVSKGALGRYRRLAVDPKTPPVTLTDAADRALFGFVEKLIAAEAPEVVSKITPEERRRIVTSEARDHGRWAHIANIAAAGVQPPETETGDSGGQAKPPNIRVGEQAAGRGTAPGRVGDVTTERPPGKIDRPVRGGKGERPGGGKIARPERPPAAPVAPVLVPTAQVQRAEPVERTKGGERSKAAPERFKIPAETFERIKEMRGEPPVPPSSTTSLASGFMTNPNPAYAASGDRVMDYPLSIVLGHDAAYGFLKELGLWDDSRRNRGPGGSEVSQPFKIGHLTSKADDENARASASLANEYAVRQAAHRASGIDASVVKHITQAELDKELGKNARPIKRIGYIQSERRRLATDIHGGVDLDRMPLEFPHPDGDGVLLVKDPNHSITEVWEFIIEDPLGHRVEGGWQLNPNEAYTVIKPDLSSPTEMVFQPYQLGAPGEGELNDKTGFVRHRMRLIPYALPNEGEHGEGTEEIGLSADFGKAETPEQRRAATAHEERSPLGRWIDQHLGTPVRTKPQALPGKTERPTRGGKAERPGGGKAERLERPAPETTVANQDQLGRTKEPPPERTKAGAPRTKAGDGGRGKGGGVERTKRMAEAADDAATKAAERNHYNILKFLPDEHYAVASGRDYFAELFSRGVKRSDFLEIRTEEQRSYINDAAINGPNAEREVKNTYEMLEEDKNDRFRDVPGFFGAPEDDPSRKHFVELMTAFLDNPETSLVTAEPIDEKGDLFKLRYNTQQADPIVVVTLDPDMTDSLRYGLELVADSPQPPVVSFSDVEWDSGSVDVYMIPVLHYKQVPLPEDAAYYNRALTNDPYDDGNEDEYDS